MQSMWVCPVMAALLINGCTPEIAVGFRTLRGDDPFQTERTRQGESAQIRLCGPTGMACPPEQSVAR
jgi:fructose-specific phosphotransferase system IIC component